MKKSNRELQNELRAKYVNELIGFLEALGEEVLLTASNQITFPTVDGAGGERWIQIVVKIPSGARKDEVAPYDGYAEAADYKFKLEEQAKKKEKA